MKTSEMKNSSGTSKSIKINASAQVIENFNSSFNINSDAEKEPAKILSMVLNENPVLNQSIRQLYRENAPAYSDYAVLEGEHKDELDTKKILANFDKICKSSKELKSKDSNKGTGIFLIPFKIASRSYCWVLLSKANLKNQLEKANGEKIINSKKASKKS